MTKNILILIALILACTVNLSAAYPLINNRNHAELNWKVCQSANFDIVFSDGLDSTAAETAKISETVYDSLSVALQLRFKNKYTIFISDMDDIGNGGTLPFNYFFIWVNPSLYKNTFTGTEGWLRKVITHEMVHAMLGEKTKDWKTSLIPLSDLPRDINEGMAQLYSGEKWGLMRGDNYLSQAAYSSNYNADAQFPDYGGLLYGKGFSVVRNLKKDFPDTTINKLFSYRSKAGLYSFDEAFKKATGKEYDSYLKNWQKNTNAYYNFRKATTENLPASVKEFPTIKYTYIKDIAFSKDKRYQAIIAVKTLGDYIPQLILYDLQDSTEKVFNYSGINRDLCFSEDSRELLFSTLHYADNGSLLTDIFAINTKTYTERKITQDARAFNPVALGKDHYAFLKSDGSKTNFYTIGINGNLKKLSDFKKNIRFEDLTVNEDKSQLAATFFDETNHCHGLAVLDIADGKYRELVTDSVLFFRPLYRPGDKNTLIYTHAGSDVNNLWSINLVDGSKKQITNQVDYLLGTKFLTPDTLLTIIQNDRGNNKLYKIGIERTPQYFTAQINPLYSDWLLVQANHPAPSFSFKNVPVKFTGDYKSWQDLRFWYVLPVPVYINNKISVGVTTMMSDPLLKHSVSAYLAADYEDLNKINYSLGYTNKSTPLNISLGFGDMDALQSSLYAGKELAYNSKSGMINFNLPYNRGYALNENYNFGLGLNWSDVKVVNPEYFIANQQILNGEIAAPIDYKSAALTFDVRYKKVNYFNPAGYNPSDAFMWHTFYTIENSKLYSDFSSQTGKAEMYLINNSLVGKPLAKLIDNAELPLLDRMSVNIYQAFRWQEGKTAAQKQIGIDRYTHVDVASLVPVIASSPQKYIRGNDKYFFGNRIYDFSTELYLPVTKELGLGWPKQNISIDHFGIAAFMEGASIWNNADFDNNQNILRHGVEAKGAFSFFSQLLAYAGLSRNTLDKAEKEQFYWGIKTFFPF